MRIYLIRHGEAEGNRDRRYHGATDLPLTAHGMAQAAALGEAFADVELAAVYTSPLARARATAAAIAAHHQLTPVVLEDLRELHFGAWEGQTRAEVQASDAAGLAAWESDQPDAAPPGGESPATVLARVATTIKQLAVRHSAATIAAVTHVMPMKLAICAALDLPPRSVRRLWLDTAGIVLIEWDGETDHALVRLVNATRPDR